MSSTQRWWVMLQAPISHPPERRRSLKADTRFPFPFAQLISLLWPWDSWVKFCSQWLRQRGVRESHPLKAQKPTIYKVQDVPFTTYSNTQSSRTISKSPRRVSFFGLVKWIAASPSLGHGYSHFRARPGMIQQQKWPTKTCGKVMVL